MEKVVDQKGRTAKIPNGPEILKRLSLLMKATNHARSRSKRRRERALAVGLLLITIMFFGCTDPGRVWLQRKLMYFPSRELVDSPALFQADWEDAEFGASDGTRLHGWFIRSAGKRVILICHGNGGNVSDRLELCQLLHRLGVNVFIFDYRGFGRSEGTPDELGTYLDAVASYDWLRAKGFQPKEIIALGESLGGAVAADLATKRELGGLVLQSTFTSMTAVAKEVYFFLPVKWICTFKYDTLSKLPTVHVPILILHGERDKLIPMHHARELYAAANSPKLLKELPGDHNGALASDPAAYSSAVGELLKLIETGEHRLTTEGTAASAR